jgi:F-type H+-transporting ATPase subunit alpha
MGTELDAATQQRLDRGYRLNELLKQGICKPMHVIDQCISIYAATRGYLDKVPVTKVQEYEKGLLEYFHTAEQATWEKIDAERKLTDEVESEMKRVIGKFTEDFQA